MRWKNRQYIRYHGRGTVVDLVTIEAYRWSGGTAPFILGTRWRREGQYHVSAALLLGKLPSVPRRTAFWGKENNLFSPPGIEARIVKPTAKSLY